ncbi:MAG: omptin family outer membrane protease [Treponema sp.]|uniref:hypothetical protein n=1 Tax=Treponema sp. TaxID=166 RepID=UPI002600EE16|nr:hypothetical protein [Treponema sp.]MBQ9282043.1 omptin family outer membrane protease [Treponema sp.]
MKAKKLFFLIIPCFLISAAASASDFTFEFMPYAGITYGQFNEYIYSGADSSILRSLLEWEAKPLINLGAGTKIGWKKLSLETRGEFTPCMPCGTLKDSDWNEDGDVKYIYSLLEERVSEAFSFSSMLSYDFDFEESFYVAPALIFDYSHIKIKGTNGEGWFASASYSSTGNDEAWNSGYARYYGKGKLHGINYERTSYSFFSGLKVGARFSRRFSSELGFFISPITSISVFDTHLTGKNTQNYHLNEYAKSMFSAYKLYLRTEYDLSKLLALSLSADFSGTDIIKRYMYHNYHTSSPVKSNQKMGASSFSFAARLGIKIKIIH